MLGSWDVAVIGGGLAGAAAALTAAEGGAETVVISKGPGATALSGGAMDICGSPIADPGLPWNNFTDLRTNIAETVARRPCHPYSVLSATRAEDRVEWILSAIEKALQTLRRPLANQGLAFKGDLTKLKPSPTALGSWKLTSFAQSSQQLGAPEGTTAVVGIKGLAVPDAAQLAAMLEATFVKTGLGNVKFGHIEIKMGDGKCLTMEQLRAIVSTPGRLDDFISRVADKAGKKYDTLIIPPVLPLSQSAGLKLDGKTEVRESLAAGAGSPGERLHKALEGALKTAGARVVSGAATDFERDGRSIVSCSVSYDGVYRRLAARKWILATGKYIGGGISKNGTFKEKALGLPLFRGARHVTGIFVRKLLNERFLERHPAFEVGVRTDESLRPVNGEGKVVFHNLRAAGSVIGGYNYHRDTCGLGVCLLTGWLAGKS